MFKSALLWLSVFCCVNLYAQDQTGTIFGSVRDQVTGEGLGLATVVVDDGGVAADFDGKYSIEVPYGKHVLKVSYVGYEPMVKEVDLQAASLEVNFSLGGIFLQEARVVTDIVIDRETPVAVSNIEPLKIEEELGSQPIPMILNTTPGVYAATEGSDDTGPSISIRGFKQRNVSVMVDGIPVNDMENGAVYWNNWFGLDLVTQTMQVQRGLGASKLALPAIGGTVNIVTQGIESKRKTLVKQELGTTGLVRTTIGHTSGRLDGGWGYTVAGSFKRDRGFVDEYFSEAFFYYGKIQKELGNHLLSFTVTGSPSQNATRSYRQRIATYDNEYARSLFTGSDEDYSRMEAYSSAYYNIFNDQTLSPEESVAAFDLLNDEYGYGSVQDFEDEMSATNFIDTNIATEKGIGYNVHWGEREGEVLYERQNKYHKPLASLKHSWNVSDKFFVVNNFYGSYGFGGGTRLNPGLGAGDYTADGQIDFQRFYDGNTIGGVFGPPIDPAYHPTERKSSTILRKLFNNHQWLGLLSTFQWTQSEKLIISGGLDLRTYKGEHYSEVFDLLGGDYFIDESDANSDEAVKRVGDKINYYNDSFVRWGGIFGLAEYSDELWNAFFSISAVTQGYKRVDYFGEQDVVLEGVDGINDQVFDNVLGIGDAFVLDTETSEYQVVDIADITSVNGAEGFAEGAAQAVIIGSDTLANQYIVAHDGSKTRNATRDWIWKPGYTIKLGGSYNTTEYTSVFMNVGHLNRTPVFSNVIYFDNSLIEGTKNEIINSIEVGFKYSKYPFSFSVDAYHTVWNNRPVNSLLSLETEDGERIRANITGMNALHQGIEFDAAYQIRKNLTIEGVIALGKWQWTSSEDSLALINEITNLPYIDPITGNARVIAYDADGVAVGDAPQTQIGGSLKYTHKSGLYLKPRLTYFSRHYADFDPFSLNGDNARRQSWQIPAYTVMDLHMGYNLKLNETPIDLRLSIFNVLNTLYISNAQNNDSNADVILPNAEIDDRYPFNENNFDASSASVYMGYGLRTNFSVRVRF